VNRSYEAFDLGLDLPCIHPDTLAGKILLGPNVWPILNGFQETLADFHTKISTLGQLVCSALELHLKLPAGAMTDHTNEPEPPMLKPQ
jgi:isopenicillin N synthase-like dioxygenase